MIQVATTTMGTVDNILKEIYEDGINDQLQSEIVALTRIEKTSEGVTHEVGGKYVRFPVRTQRNQGMGARIENEPLPVPGTQSYASAQVKLKYLYGSIQLTGQTFELADKNFQAFASALDQEVNGMKEGLKKDTARQIYGTPVGKLVVATGAGSTTTLVTSDAGAQYLEVGMVVDCYTSADVANGVGIVITGLTSSGGNTTVTLGTAVTATATGAYLTRTLNKDKEINGFNSIVQSTGQLYAIDPATVPVWAASVDANGGTNRVVTEGLMINMVDTIRRKGGGSPSVIFCGLGVRRAYFNLLVQQRRLTNTTEFTGGFKGLAFTVDSGEIPIVSDMDCPANLMHFLNEKELKLYQAGDWGFMNRDGSNWQRVITSAGSYDAYGATMYKYMEMGTHRRNSHGRINDLTEG
jgi:hypothetical protein